MNGYLRPIWRCPPVMTRTRLEKGMAQPTSRSLWHLIESIAVAMAQGYGLARVRALSHPSAMIRMLAQRDHLYSEASLLEREIAIFRAQRLAKSPRRRPQFAPEQRGEILQLIALRGWSVKYASNRFGLHPNTIRNWKRLLRDKHKTERRFGEPPWNRLHDAVRWTVHEIRRLCPEREFGTRTIARHMLRAGIGPPDSGRGAGAIGSGEPSCCNRNTRGHRSVGQASHESHVTACGVAH